MPSGSMQEVPDKVVIGFSSLLLFVLLPTLPRTSTPTTSASFKSRSSAQDLVFQLIS